MQKRDFTTAYDASAGQRDGISDRLEYIGDPKVGNLKDAARAVNQNVLRLEITMLFCFGANTHNQQRER